MLWKTNTELRSHMTKRHTETARRERRIMDILLAAAAPRPPRCSRICGRHPLLHGAGAAPGTREEGTCTTRKGSAVYMRRWREAPRRPRCTTLCRRSSTGRRREKALPRSWAVKPRG